MGYEQYLDYDPTVSVKENILVYSTREAIERGRMLRLKIRTLCVLYKEYFYKGDTYKKDTRDTVTIVTEDTRDIKTIVTEDIEDTITLISYEFPISI